MCSLASIPGRILRIPLEKSVKVLAFDPNFIVALDKPCGILSQPSGKSDSTGELCLLKGASYNKKEYYQYSYLDSEGKKSLDKFWLLNRLDSATSGVILGCCDEVVAEGVKRLFKERAIHKIYYARVFGSMKQHKSYWENAMDITKSKSILAVGPSSSKYNRNSAKIARANVQFVEFDKRTNTSLIELSPLTGYSHQLRFQCAENGFPIVGDKVYGHFDSNKLFQEVMKSANVNSGVKLQKRNYKRLMLHSRSIEFEYNSGDQLFKFSAVSPVPDKFKLTPSI